MGKIKVNILMLICGLLLIITSLVLGFFNNFSGGQGGLMLILGVAFLAVGVVFIPKIWASICVVADLVLIFFNGPK